MQNKTIDVGAVIESAKFTWVTASIALMMIVIMLADGYDLFLMGHVGNHLVSDWGVSRADLDADQHGGPARHGGGLHGARLARRPHRPQEVLLHLPRVPLHRLGALLHGREGRHARECEGARSSR